MKRLRDIGEDALIERLVRLAPLDDSPASGPGDDCAVVDTGHGPLQLLKTDALVEGVHYLPEHDARRVGWKAAARVVSDFAAMGGVPDRFLVTLALPPDLSVAWIEDFYRGLGDCLREFGAVLSGGETARVPDGSAAVISIAATGHVPRERLVLRGTASPGDILLVTGRLGGSITGKHLDFTPRIRESGWLTSHFKPSAMMDLSDGLGKDLPRLAAASGCGYELDEPGLPRTDGSTTRQAISDGEDFELLLAMPPDRVEALLAAWPAAFPDLPLTVIGKLLPAGEGRTISGGWDHFAAG